MPKLILHTAGPLNMLSSILGVIERRGVTIERRDYDIPGMQTTDGVHLVWGMKHRPEVYEELAKLDHVYFVENGWFTQHTGCYIDKTGPNGMSSIRHACSSQQSMAATSVTPEMKTRVANFIVDLHRGVNLQGVTSTARLTSTIRMPTTRPSPFSRSSRPQRYANQRYANQRYANHRIVPRPSNIALGGEYYFVPMQVERDSQLLFWANCPVAYPHRQKWWIEQICQAFPHQRIIVRPHPRDLGTAQRIQNDSAVVRKHGNIHFQSDRTSYDWIAGAKAVLGINSTVLLEALTFFKPIVAMGTGIFTGNGVVLEATGDPRTLSALHTYQPDQDQITRFLDFLLTRQIPYSLRDDEVDRFPVLREMIEKSILGKFENHSTISSSSGSDFASNVESRGQHAIPTKVE